MYNKYLKTFIAVVEKGSFNKASESLYLSPVAIMKQMNQLEKELELTLLMRNHEGIQLTDEGKIIYQEGKKIIEHSQQVLDSIKNQRKYHIRVATSTLTPAFEFIDLCKDIVESNPQYHLDMIYLDESHINTLFDGLGKEYDIVITLLDKMLWKENYQFLKIKEEPIKVMMNPFHNLAKESLLKKEDLNKQTICLAKAGYSISNDLVRDYILEHHLDVHIIDRNVYYDSNIFNQCLGRQILYPSLDVWKNINPLLVFKDVDWNLSIPYGAFYMLNAQKEIQTFIEMIDKRLKRKRTNKAD